MSQNLLTPRQSLNKSFLKLKPSRKDIEHFKSHLIGFLDGINEKESEEFQKNLISDFLKKIAFEPNFYINTKGRNDLVIHTDKSHSSPVGVIIETKQSANSGEMMTVNKLNTKSFQELVLYYLRERITLKNLEVKHLIATNTYEWFIFDAVLFETLFAKNKVLVKKFEDFEAGRLSGVTTDFFYTQIAKPFIDEVAAHIVFTHFNLRDYDKVARNADKKDDSKLISLVKIFSPQHLLKLPFVNDSNTLDKGFYNELLHIIGLTEIKEGGKRLIDRNKSGERNSGSLLEDTIIQLDSLDKVGRAKRIFLQGETYDEKLFNIALELNITWINRILFLKLLEGQLISYHEGDRSYAFLNINKIKHFDDLNTLFFQVLAKKFEDRNSDVYELFKKVPYLNSSLFEPTELEHNTLMLSNLRDEKKIPILGSTVLKDSQGRKRTGEISTLQYVFEFLDAYDFASEGSEEIQEDNKTIINASVLGLIFEKINGYKDGSFYTPGSITMYMSREVLRKSCVDKFNEAKNWECNNFEDLTEDINSYIKDFPTGRKEARKELNQIFNSLRICDPAVGSGHFLVSVLNELISIKHDLNILCDKNFDVLNSYEITVQNDELIIEADKVFFKYNPKNKESQRVQETLFHEKETLIENCLFGVDLNPNSVKICRLRLWIELLKNAYYKTETELETLPNIDINIKNGNSLVSRFALDTDLKSAFKKSKITVDDYKNAVRDYKDAESKEKKRNLEQFLEELKASFRTEISLNSKEIRSLNVLRAEYFTKYGSEQLFGESLSKAQQKDKKELEGKITKLEDILAEIKDNRIYQNAFEWRFEFPEVLNNDGDFVGFDVIIGNPPYIQLQKMREDSDILEKRGFETFAKTGDIYSLFYEQGFNVLKKNGLLMYITSNKWMRAAYGESLRKFFAEKTNPLTLIDFSGNQIFDTATVDTNILMFAKQENKLKTKACIIKEKLLINLSVFVSQNSEKSKFSTSDSWVILSEIEQSIKRKVEAVGVPLKNWDISINYGIKTGFNEAFIIDGKKRQELIDKDPKSDQIIRPILRGRDIKRYSNDFADLYIITTFPSLKIDIEEFSAIKEHLLSFGYDRLKQTGDFGARKKTHNKWFETQDSISYWDDFSKQKIIWGEISDKTKFCIDLDGKYVNEATTFLMTGSPLLFLLGYLNSKLSEYLFSKIGTTTGVLTVRWKKFTIEQLPVPKVDAENQKIMEDIIFKLLNRKNLSTEAESLQDEFNNHIYKHLEFSSNEIYFIENQ